MHSLWYELTDWKQLKNPYQYVYNYFASDVMAYKKMTTIYKDIENFEKKLIGDKITEDHWAFITIGLNEQEVTPEKILKLSLDIQKMKYFKECNFVIERNRENGIHHHVHFLIKYFEKPVYSKIIGWIYQVTQKKIHKGLVLQKNYIDYLGPENKKKLHQPFDVYYDYIRGIKKTEKLKYVALDKIWREENNLEHLY